MKLEEYALKLKRELQLNQSQATINKIIHELSSITYEDDSKLSQEDIEKILDIMQYERTSDGSILIKDSDNSAFLKAVALLKANLKDEGDK